MAAAAELVQKLAHILQHAPDSEDGACHAIVVIRKLLETMPSQDVRQRFGILRLYCHWVLHAVIDRNKVADELVGAVDEFIQKGFFGSGVSPDEHSAFQEMFSLDTFRLQLREFLQTQQLSDAIAAEPLWSSFLTRLSAITTDAAVRPTSTTTHVASIVLSKVADSNMADAAFRPLWRITLKSGGTLELSLASGRQLLGSTAILEEPPH